MSKFIDEARKTLEARKDRSQYQKGVTLYALDILDGIEDAEQWRKNNNRAPYIFITRSSFEQAALNGADSWPHFSSCGQPLWATWDIIERLYPPSKRDRVWNKSERGEYDAIDDQARALSMAARRAWRAYSAQLPRIIEPGNMGAWARACMPADCIDHHGISEKGFMHDLYIKVTPESRELIKRLPLGENEALLSTFRDNIDGQMWYDLPFCWCPSSILEVE